MQYVDYFKIVKEICIKMKVISALAMICKYFLVLIRFVTAILEKCCLMLAKPQYYHKN